MHTHMSSPPPLAEGVGGRGLGSPFRGDDEFSLIPAARVLNAEEARHKDPGYHLLAGGRPAFEAAIGFRLTMPPGPDT